MFSSGVNLGGGGQFGAGGDMILAQAQTSTGKKTFNNSAGVNAGFNMGVFATNPSGAIVDGDMWFSATTGAPRLQTATGITTMATFFGTPLVNGELAAAANPVQFTTSDFISVSGTKTMGLSTNVATTQTLTVNGTALNIDLEILAKGQGVIIPSSPIRGIITTQQSGGGFFYSQWVNPTNTITYQAEHPIAATGSSVGGFGQNLALPSGIPNNSAVCFEIDVLGITAATGATGYYLKYLFAFRKDNSGVWTQIGAITTVIAVADLPYVPGAPTFSILGSTLTANINFTGAVAARRYTISLKLITGQ